MKKQSRTIKYIFDDDYGDEGHRTYAKDVIEHKEEIFVSLKFVNELLGDFDCRLELLPLIDRFQTPLLKYLTEDR